MEKILVIEDDLVFCKLLTSFLNKHTYNATSTSTGENAITILSNNEIDLAIIDYKLPDTTGVEIIKWINENTPNTKAILMSRLPQSEIEPKGEKYGALTFLQKPFKPATLLEIIQKIE
ncbi:MAG: response regulator [Luteibaculaceae bacterium]